MLSLFKLEMKYICALMKLYGEKILHYKLINLCTFDNDLHWVLSKQLTKSYISYNYIFNIKTFQQYSGLAKTVDNYIGGAAISLKLSKFIKIYPDFL